jgi:FKBP-type peptidyl-prolyl cis-trans isomerase FkpA
LFVTYMAGAVIAAEEAKPTTAPKPELTTDELKIAYTMGFLSGQNTLRYRFRPEEWSAYLAGLEQAAAKKAPATDTDEWRPKIQAFLAGRDAEGSAENKKVAVDFLQRVAAEPGARKMPSGLVLRTVTPGSGASPVETDQVKVKYRGRLVDGTEFDSSEKHGGSVTFGVKGVIPCWTEALKLMKVGETAEVYCPSEIAYGDRGAAPKIPGGAALHFTVELLEIVTPRPATTEPQAPEAKPNP